ncbi:MAG: alpha/beta hydrolase [Pseudonocardiaceae bacterium]
MVSFVELRDCEPAAFGLAGQRWQQLAGQVADRGNEVDKQLAALADWEGTAAEAAKTTLADERKKLRDAADQLGKIGPTLHDFCQFLGDNREKLQYALDAARDYLLEVHPDGTVTAGGLAALGGVTDPTFRAEVLTNVICDLVRTATEADERAADALRKLSAQATGFTPAANDPTVMSASQRIPSKASPADVRKWWDSLSLADQESLLFSHGAEIGGLDGIPAAVRDRVNRSLLLEQKDKLLEERSRLMTQGGNDDLRKRIDEINGKLGGIDAIEKRLAIAPSAAYPQPYLLKINSDGNGRAIVAVGDPDTASNVATYVPGTGSNLAKCGYDLDRADRMARAAASAHSPSTSVITWIGYDAPQSIIPDAAFEKYALGAEKDLQGFQDGLRATHDGPPSHNTVIGHSYGTTTIGYAARDGSLNANDVVFVASPGVGVLDAGGLHLTGVDPSQNSSHIHSTTAAHDIIKVADGSFGPNPSMHPEFGGQTFRSAPGNEGPWYEPLFSVKAHSQYWDLDNPALDNMGRVIAGKPTH